MKYTSYLRERFADFVYRNFGFDIIEGTTWQPYISECAAGKNKYSWYDESGTKHSLSAYREPLFGFEIEVASGDDNKKDWRAARKLSRIVSRNQYLSCHYESSIYDACGAGFEIRSEPATLSFFMNRMDWSFLRKLERFGARTVGVGEKAFHIHVDRRAFVDDAHIERFARHISTDVSIWGKSLGWAYSGAYAQLIRHDSDFWRDGHKFRVVAVRGSTVEVRCLAPTFNESRAREYFFYVNTVAEMTKGDE